MASRVPDADLQAARRYGRLVDPIAAQYTNPLNGKRLSGEALLLKLAKGESGFDASADSGKAHGTTQFTPGSRQTAISRFGIDPWRSKDEAYHAAALHLLGKINGSKGLQGYNPGSSSYPSYILNQAVGNVGGSLGGGGSAGGGGTTTTTTTAGAPPQADLGAGSTAATDLVASLLQARQPAAPAVSAPAAPSFSAQAVMPQGYQAPSGGSPQAPPDVSALLAAVRTAGVGPAQDDSQTTTTETSSAGGGGGSSSHGGVTQFDGKPVASWIAPILEYARGKGWKGSVQSGYRTDAEQTAIYKRGVRPAAVPKSMGGAGSNHERTGFLQGAIDVTDAATLDRILRAKHSRLKYAGAKDPVHFSVPRGGSY